MNGKIDLAQAEAVQELICAKNERSLTAAENQLQGVLSAKIESFQKDLIQTAAILEALGRLPGGRAKIGHAGMRCASDVDTCLPINGKRLNHDVYRQW